MQYPFADIELARRLEQTEGQGNANFIDARQKAFPDWGAESIEVAGTRAMFDGPGSPLTQTFGLGMFEPLTPEQLDEIEHFFQTRGADVFHEVCPLADPSTFALLNERGYKPIESSNVLYRPISPDFRLEAWRNEQVQVRLIRKDEIDVWAQTASDGWSEFTEIADYLRDLGQVTARSKSLSFLAELDGNPIATGALTISGDVALLAGASTIPSARRQGAQLALLEGRLRYAAAQGCTIAMMVAQPGSGSQRNAERHGFRIAYTRYKWQLQGKQEQDAGL
ncbi:MAG: GNAT family N-acetyltransferase [Acidobacteria bacterium]|nr:GNAT family N-acetyltransferase [Acidobacteriota bacterium]MCA1627133.1 GNAT family N-acetyltransferase [Acidobacteriota bacterium]